MDLKEVMGEKVFAVLGNTLDEEKYAAQIKNGLNQHGYKTYAVGKELKSLNEIPEEIDIIDMCINPVKGLELLKEYDKKVKTVVLQPGAESDEIKELLEERNIDYLEGCLLVGLKLYT